MKPSETIDKALTYIEETRSASMGPVTMTGDSPTDHDTFKQMGTEQDALDALHVNIVPILLSALRKARHELINIAIGCGAPEINAQAGLNQLAIILAPLLPETGTVKETNNIRCPKCQYEQLAVRCFVPADNTVPNYAHECLNCKYVITAADWDIIQSSGGA